MGKTKKVENNNQLSAQEEERLGDIWLDKKFTAQHHGECGACKWWSRHHTEGVAGRCEYYPPAIRFDKDDWQYSCWPETGASDRCSKYKFKRR